MMFPTLDNVQEYLNTKQWDRLLKEYSKYKVIIQQTKESNVVLEMVRKCIERMKYRFKSR